ncbi:MAG: adenine phosphoribosyltransferase [Sulfobacillus sp.]
MAWTDLLREIPDFPMPGVLFRDVLPVMANAEAWHEALDGLEHLIRPLGAQAVVAPEARGFLIAAPLADRLRIGLIPVRKPGKLPDPILREAYSLEYGDNQLEIEENTPLDGLRVVIVDDVLATGGTVAACARLVERLSANVVGYAFLIELQGLLGRQRLDLRTADIITLLTL